MRQKIALGTAVGGVVLAVLFGLGKMAIDFRRWREDISKDKAPWER